MQSAYSRWNVIPNDQTMDLWYQHLKDLDYKSLSAALSSWITTNKFPPTIADLRESCNTVQNGEIPLWSDGWEEVLRLIRSYGYMRETEALESMSELTRETVKRMGWKTLCTSENISIERGHFRMIYNELAERHHKHSQLPPAIKKLIGSVKLLDQKGE